MFKIFSDFDNTITTVDCTNYILKHFADKLWLKYEQDYEDNKISGKECLEKQIVLLKINLGDLEHFIVNNITILKDFLDFVEICKNFSYPLTIVSNGLDLVIKLVLKKYSLTHIPFYSNKLSFRSTYNVLFPFNSLDCKVNLGMCKCNILNKLKFQYKCVYIGDGKSDFCVVQNIPNLIIIAKDKLLEFCKKKHIKHYPFKNFYDVILILEELKRNING